MSFRFARFGQRWGVSGAVLGAAAACAGESALPSPAGLETSAGATSQVSTLESTGSSAEQGTITTASSSKPGSTSAGVSSTGFETGSATTATSTGSGTTPDQETSSGQAATEATSSDTTSTTSNGGSPSAITALEEYLELPPEERPDLQSAEFAQMPLSKQQAQQAQDLLWSDHVAAIEATRSAEHQAKAITLDGKTMKYDYTVFGEAPPTGRSLVLSLHGGGEADASVNDEQWENQKGLYTLDEGIYLSPRAPTNTWNLWHEAHIDPMFERLIENFIALEGVDPNRVYVMGYSAGGDGVYQLGPRMADHWAAASAMAGHPNEAKLI